MLRVSSALLAREAKIRVQNRLERIEHQFVERLRVGNTAVVAETGKLLANETA